MYVRFLILTCTIYILAPKGSEAILEQPQDNTFENVEEDMSQSISESKSKSTSKPIAKSTLKSTSKSSKDDEEVPFVSPTLEMVQAYCREKGYHIDPEAFIAYYDAVGWSVGKRR